MKIPRCKVHSVLYVPAWYTDNLQLLDLTVNKSFRKYLRHSFQNWYGDQVRQQLDRGTSMCDITVDLRLSSIRTFACWLNCTLLRQYLSVLGLSEVGFFRLVYECPCPFVVLLQQNTQCLLLLLRSPRK